jgi:hypothetical protein
MGGVDRMEVAQWMLFIAAIVAIAITINVYGEPDATQHYQSQSVNSESRGMHLSPVPIGPKLGNGLHLNPGWAP